MLLHVQHKLFNQDTVHYTLLVVDHEVHLIDFQGKRVDIALCHVDNHVFLTHQELLLGRHTHVPLLNVNGTVDAAYIAFCFHELEVVVLPT